MENEAREMRGPGEKYPRSPEIEPVSPSLSHLPTAPQGEEAFLGVNERLLWIPFLSEAVFGGARGPGKLCLTSPVHVCSWAQRERAYLPIPLFLPTVPVPTPPHPTPPLPGGLSSYSGVGEGISLATRSWLSFDRLSGVPMSLPACPLLRYFLPPQPSELCKGKALRLL